MHTGRATTGSESVARTLEILFQGSFRGAHEPPPQTLRRGVTPHAGVRVSRQNGGPKPGHLSARRHPRHRTLGRQGEDRGPSDRGDCSGRAMWGLRNHAGPHTRDRTAERRDTGVGGVERPWGWVLHSPLDAGPLRAARRGAALTRLGCRSLRPGSHSPPRGPQEKLVFSAAQSAAIRAAAVKRELRV